MQINLSIFRTCKEVFPVVLINKFIYIFCYFLYITIEKYTIFQLKSIPVLIVCEDKKSYLNAG